MIPKLPNQKTLSQQPQDRLGKEIIAVNYGDFRVLWAAVVGGCAFSDDAVGFAVPVGEVFFAGAQ